MKGNYMQIGGRRIGEGYPPLIIVELGINHSGNLQTALEMVDAAHEAGAEVIKHQTHVIEDEMSLEAKHIIPPNANVSIYEIMARCALSVEDELQLKEYVEKKGMIFLSTPFSRAAADRLEHMGVLAFKIGSGEMNNYPLLDYVASFGKPMIVSTGMNNIDNVRKAVQILENRGVDYALLHTTNIYPTPPELVRLGGMQELQREFPDAIIGLSDHTVNNNACIAAVALGASILERHFTDKKDREGPDIICSMTPQELKNLINSANEIFKMQGGKKEAAREEQATMDFAFATVVAIRDIKKGEAFSKENLWAKRPGIGEIKAENYNSILGKIATQDIPAGIHVKWRMIEK